MEMANLILEYVKALAWPVVVVIAVLVFRAPFAAFLRRMRSLEAEAFGITVKGTDQTPGEVAARLATLHQISPNIPAKLQSAAPVVAAPTRSDYTRATMEALLSAGIDDPDLRLFMGVFLNNVAMVEEAVKAGANVNVTDTEVLRRYADRLADPQIKKRILERAAAIRAETRTPDNAR